MVYTLRIPVLPIQTQPTRNPERCYNEDAMFAALDLFKTISCLQQLQGLTNTSRPEKWVKKIRISDVDPESISLKVNGVKLHVRAVKETGDSENGETTEIRRTFILPKDIDTEKIESKVEDGGILKLEAPFRNMNEHGEKNSKQTCRTKDEREEQPKEEGKKDKKEKEADSSPTVWRRRFCLKGFKMDNVKVSVRNNVVTIEGEMKMSENDGSSLSMTKIISVPENVNVDNLKCRMYSEGNLELEAPFMNDMDGKNQANVSNQKDESISSHSENTNDKVWSVIKTEESEGTRKEDSGEQNTEKEVDNYRENSQMQSKEDTHVESDVRSTSMDTVSSEQTKFGIENTANDTDQKTEKEELITEEKDNTYIRQQTAKADTQDEKKESDVKGSHDN